MSAIASAPISFSSSTPPTLVEAPLLAVAFAGERRIASGFLPEVAVACKRFLDEQPDSSLLLFDDESGRPIEVDFRGSEPDVVNRLAAQYPSLEVAASAAAELVTPRGPGRPKLGVIPREVTLLPRHWGWLAEQPGGASVTLRKLVEEAIKTHAVKDRKRRAQEACYRFMTAVAGNLPQFEEANRALFSGDRQRFMETTSDWPQDLREQSLKMADAAF